MEITFLGTGSAWGLPELGCGCRVCNTMRERGEERLRTCLLVETGEVLLVDCGPDIRRQLAGRLDAPPDAVLLTHAHGDHFLGLDDLVAFRRVWDRERWRPIPLYATEEAWARVEQVFGYLVGNLLEKRIARVGRPLEGIETRVTPFATDHGPSARGSVGYRLEERQKGETVRMVYTGDFMSLPEDPHPEGRMDLLILQCHWLHEPHANRPHHMSFQRGLEIIDRWAPERVYLVHLSEEYPVEGDPFSKGLKSVPPKAPLVDPRTGSPYPQPLCHEDWQQLVASIARDRGIPLRPVVARDGLAISLEARRPPQKLKPGG